MNKRGEMNEVKNGKKRENKLVVKKEGYKKQNIIIDYLPLLI